MRRMLRRLLIANRGEIAIRIAQAGGGARHRHGRRPFRGRRHLAARPQRVDEAVALKGAGAAAYLDIAGVVAAARKARLRRDPSGLRLPVGECRLRAGLRRGRARVRRPDAGAARAVRRQGARARPGREVRGAGAAGHRRRDRPRGRDGVLQEAREGGHRAQGDRRRRRARHAAGHARGRDRRGLRARLGRGQVGLRQRRPLCRAAGRAGRATSRCRSSATARAASWPWASANAACSGAARRSSSWRPARTSSRRCARRSSMPAIAMAKAVKYRSLGTFEFLVDGDGLLLHRGQSAPAGRAHGHRGGLGRRPGAGAARLAGGASLAESGLDQAPRRAAMRSSSASTWRP